MASRGHPFVMHPAMENEMSGLRYSTPEAIEIEMEPEAVVLGSPTGESYDEPEEYDGF